MERVIATLDPREAELAEFIRTHLTEVEPLMLGHNEAVWRANTSGEPEAFEQSAKLDAQLRRVYSRPEPLARLLAIERSGAVRDPLLRRQLRLLILTHRAQQFPPADIEEIVRLEKSLESRFNLFRAEFRGERVSDNRLREILRHSLDLAERRDAWEAAKQVGVAVHDDLLTLVRLRNRVARGQGFANYYSMMLELDELDEGELFALLDELEAGTRPLFATYKGELDERQSRRFGVPPGELRPWHHLDPFFQEAPAADLDLDRHFAGRSLEDLTARFFGAIGLDVGDLLRRADLYERPGKSQHAFCLSVDRGDDVRVLCNLQTNENWMGTMLHEFGHAVYDKYVDRTLPFLLRTHAHILTTEASAMLFGRLSRDAAWLERYAGVSAEESRAMGARTRRAVRDHLLVVTRWCLVMSHMERALYHDPDRNLDALWWDLVERFQLVRRPDGRQAPDWASKIHFTVAPVYYHNYMLGEMMASQLHRTLLHDVLGGGADAAARYVASPEVGRFLIEKLYGPGGTEDWRGTLRRATGESLRASAFVADLLELST